jgi:hypothetical protein
MATELVNRENFQIFTRLSTPEIPPFLEECIKGGLISLRELILAHRDLIINAALVIHQGNQCNAAKALGMHRNTLGRVIDDMLARGALKASLRHSDYKKTAQRSDYSGPERRQA